MTTAPTAEPLLRTPFDRREFARALLRAWRVIFGAFPTKSAAGVVWAQYALETGRGAACWNYNLGNVKATEAQARAGVPFTMLPNTWEIIGGKRVVFQPPHPQTWFRAFRSLEEGMAHHLRFLAETRYRDAWSFVVAGDPVGFAYRLKALGYFTAPADTYAFGLRALLAEWMRSDDFDHELGEVLRDAEAETNPAIPAPPSTRPDLSTVRGVQLRLRALGFDPGPIDNVMGERTRSAVRTFQASRGLITDGVVGPRTLDALAR
jgi:hypothetical protein